MTKFLRDYKNIIIFTLGYWLVNFLLFISHVDFLLPWLIWNTFLALVPLAFIYFAKEAEGKKLTRLVLSLGWLFFFPNSIYLITDFIHLSNEVFYQAQPYQGVVYVEDIFIWIKLVDISLAYLLGTVLALKSLIIFLDMIEDIWNKKIRTLALFIVSFLTGIAIYIGRFLRFNSWDIVRPFALIKKLYSSLNTFALGFIALFTFYTLAIYAFYKSLKKKDN